MGEIPLSSLLEDVVRLVSPHYCTSCKLQCCTVVYTCTRFLAHTVMHYLHSFACFVAPHIDACNVSPLPLFEPNVRYTAHGPLFMGLRYMYCTDYSHLMHTYYVGEFSHVYEARGKLHTIEEEPHCGKNSKSVSIKVAVKTIKGY